MTRTILASGAICALAMSAMVGAEAQSPAPAVPTFSRDVAPIL